MHRIVQIKIILNAFKIILYLKIFSKMFGNDEIFISRTNLDTYLH